MDTISVDDICFIDSETRRIDGATVDDVTRVGANRYADQAFAVMWTFRIGREPVQIMALDDGFDERLTWEVDAPDELKRFHDRVVKGEAYYGAWNMGFDRKIWNGPESDFPKLEVEHTLDIMAQGVASGLPGKLKSAASFVGLTQKLEQGDSLIKMFEPPNGATPQSNPEQWALYREYGMVDTDALFDIFSCTRPLSRTEWEQYWVSERINDRGMKLDTLFCAAASVLVDADQRSMNEGIERLTGGAADKVTQAARILQWANEQLAMYERYRSGLIGKKLILNEDGSVKRPEKLSLAREGIEKILVLMDHDRELGQLPLSLEPVYDVLTLRQYGGSTTPQKFAKALRMQHNGILKGQYVYNGAPQTGRFSSRDVQVHNLTRKTISEPEADVIDLICELQDPLVQRRLEAAK